MNIFRIFSKQLNYYRPQLNELGFDLQSHTPYPEDLVPNDFHLFLNLKKYLRRKRFSDDE